MAGGWSTTDSYTTGGDLSVSDFLGTGAFNKLVKKTAITALMILVPLATLLLLYHATLILCGPWLNLMVNGGLVGWGLVASWKAWSKKAVGDKMVVKKTGLWTAFWVLYAISILIDHFAGHSKHYWTLKGIAFAFLLATAPGSLLLIFSGPPSRDAPVHYTDNRFTYTTTHREFIPGPLRPTHDNS